MTSHTPSQMYGDAGAMTIAGLTLLEWLPPMAVALTIVWTLLRIYETVTVQRLLRVHAPKLALPTEEVTLALVARPVDPLSKAEVVAETILPKSEGKK